MTDVNRAFKLACMALEHLQRGIRVYPVSPDDTIEGLKEEIETYRKAFRQLYKRRSG